MVPIGQIPTQHTLRRIQRIQAITIAWMSAEAVLSLWAAWTARSPALAAFGGDSGVELLSASVVLWRFRTHAPEHTEQRAARIASGLLFVLIAYVVLASLLSLLHYSEAKNQLPRDCTVGGSSDYHARACKGETASISPNRKRRSEGGCCRECHVCLPLDHRSHRSRGSCQLARCVGRPCGSVGDYTFHCD
jgi:hypothetical protein